MNVQASIEQVAGILHRAGIEFDTHDNGRSYRVPFERDAVFLHFADWHDQVRIIVTSPALQELDPDDASYALAMNTLNDLNERHVFVKWTLTDGTLLAAHDLLGDQLAAKELLNAVFAVAGAVRSAAEELEDETGGLRYDEMIAVD